jgi:hypothetical protein
MRFDRSGVDVGNDDNIAGASGKAEIDGRALAAAVLEPQHRVNLALALQVLGYFKHPVRRAVVDDDHLYGAARGQDCLLGQRLDGGAQRLFLVMTGEYHAQGQIGADRKRSRALPQAYPANNHRADGVTWDLQNDRVPEKQDCARGIE